MRCSSALLGVDETLYPYRGHIGFKQYNPQKLAKYGLSYRSLCYSAVTSTYLSLTYAGKPDLVCRNGAKFYITDTDEYTKYLVKGISCYTSIQGCNISMDRYFKSGFLSEWALRKKFTIVGTMRHDRKSNPKEVKAIGTGKKSRCCMSITKRKTSCSLLISTRKNQEKKNVFVFLTMHDSVKVTNDQRKESQIHSMYDHAKGGVDVTDVLSTLRSTRIKSKRWPINAFAFILDIC